MLVGTGLSVAIWAAKKYPMGTADSMGPAYFPTVLGGVLAFLGVVLTVASLGMDGPRVARFHFRPLVFTTLALVAYGYLMRPLGLVGAIAALVFISAFGGHEFKWKEVTILYVVLLVFSWLVFVKGLTLPFRMWPQAFY
jgi:hypothetical protein